METSLNDENPNETLFDHIWKQEKVSPEEFLKLGSALLSQYQSRPQEMELLTKAHQCWEKAAELYENTGNFSRAYKVRSDIIVKMSPPSTHPLYNLESVVDDYTKKPNVFEDDGAKFAHLDSGVLKRGILTVRKRDFEGEKKLVANFHISHFAQKKLAKTVSDIRQHLNEFVNELPAVLKGEVIIREVDNGYYGKEGEAYSHDLSNGVKLGKAIEIEIKGVGVIRIAKDDQYYSMRNRVVFEVSEGTFPGESLKKLQEIATLMGLGPIFGVESSEEEERKKIMLLFRTFYPQEAFPLENTQKPYEISIEGLKKMILDQQPEMKNIFETYLSNPEMMQKVEIAPEVSVWSVRDLSERMRAEGAIGLMNGFTGDPEILVAMLTQGSLCSQERFERGHVFTGTSPGQDHIHGGAGFVFSRLIHRKMTNTLQKQFVESSDSYEDHPASLVRRYPHSGDYQLLYDLSVVNTGAFAYNEDYYGSKSSARYGKRNNLIEFTKSLNENSMKNEVMVRERLPPDKLQKILVSSEAKKTMLIESLRQRNLIIEDDGKLYIKGCDKSLDELFVVGRYLTEDMWKKEEEKNL